MTVFLLMLWFGWGDDRTLSPERIYFHRIDHCNYVAHQLTKRYTSYMVEPSDRVTAYCVPMAVESGDDIAVR